MSMSWNEIAAAARPAIGEHCKACPVCNGRACRNEIPGPGAKGVGDVAMRNYDAWRDVRVNMDTLVAAGEVDTSCELLGRRWSMPLFIGPVGDVNRHYGPSMTTLDYNRMALAAAAAEGVAAFTGDGVDERLFSDSCTAIAEAGGAGVPTVKPWGAEVVEGRMGKARACGAFAVAMDVDAAGLPFLKGLEPPAGPKSGDELRQIVDAAGMPFVVKGVMTPRGALKAVEAGASAVAGRCAVLVDGGIRSGLDVFRALALGADGVLVCRPFVVAAYGAGQAGIETLLRQFRSELADAMEMCGARSVAEIAGDMVWRG